MFGGMQLAEFNGRMDAARKVQTEKRGFFLYALVSHSYQVIPGRLCRPSQRERNMFFRDVLSTGGQEHRSQERSSINQPEAWYV